MFKYFTAYGTRKYIDVLQQIVSAYNNRIHRSINMKPADVNDANEKLAYNNLYKNDKLKYMNLVTYYQSGQLLGKSIIYLHLISHIIPIGQMKHLKLLVIYRVQQYTNTLYKILEA